MPKKILYIINIISGIALFFSLSECVNSSLIFSCLAGAFLGFAQFIILSSKKLKLNKIVIAVSIVLGLLLSAYAAYSFYGTWISSEDTVRTLVTRIFPDYSQGLIVISVLVLIISLPFAVTFFGLIPYIVKNLKPVSIKRIWSELVKGLSAKSFFRSFAIIVANLVIGCILATGLLYAVYLLPINKIDRNVGKSTLIFYQEGSYPELTGYATSTLDNWTDSVIVLEAASPRVESPIKDAMNVPRPLVGEEDSIDVIVSHYYFGERFDGSVPYTRYWHGFLILMKPLLMFFNYGTIRIINGVVQALLVLLTCFLLFKNKFRKAIIPYALSFLMMMPIALAKSIQFSACFYVFTLGSIALLLMKKETRQKHSSIVFLWIGIMTAFFDLLTYPISTFGVPIVFFLLLSEDETLERKISQSVRNAICWGVGFGGMWVLKWAAASIVNGRNEFSVAMSFFAIRTSSVSDDGEKFSLYATEIRNYGAFSFTPVTILVVLMIAYLCFRFLKNRKISMSESLIILLPFVIAGLMPAIWYAFATNHSMIHFWFTNKACVTSLLAVLFGMVSLLQVNSKKAV